ncbi:transcriptional regulator [Streptomyces celluloflavus]|uniref:transcriptional regulator n=1 Tax=Streptomyces celluloflavus TaxID=58344 RepID=UPI003663C89A
MRIRCIVGPCCGPPVAPCPLYVLDGFDEALALLPSPARTPTAVGLSAEYRMARALFDKGAHTELVTMLPALLATSQARADAGDAADFARLAGCYDLATEALSKIGRYSASRITADRSHTYAWLSGSPLASAASARAFSIVLRHEDRADTAQRVTLGAAARIEATGLTTPAQAAAFAQMLCTAAYSAAQAGDRDRALEMIGDAERAAALLPDQPAGPRHSFSVTPASVTLYKVGVLWSLGDAGAAVHTGRNLHPAQFPTAERRGRLHTDLARAWWQWGKAEQTAHALQAAHRAAPSEVRDRPGIRSLVTDLAERHPRTSGVRELVAATRIRPT